MSGKELKERLKLLLAQRDLLEAEADAIHSELTSPGLNGEPPVGVKGSLVDDEGFPRADLDLYNVKNKRARLASINFDHKNLMKVIEALLTQIHEVAILEEGPVELSRVPPAESLPKPPAKEAPRKAIAVLDELLDGSPAAEAGVINGDLLIQFGHVTASDAGPLPAIAALVGASVNKNIVIVVSRLGTDVKLALVPRPWGGRGLLGCHLTPVS